jgi:hypothetical protein
MSDPTQIPWEELRIVALTVIILFAAGALISMIVAWVEALRNELRDRFLGGRWDPDLIDLLVIPAWIALEIVCLAFILAFGLIAALLAYQAAKDVRDWWHAGDKGRR